jgi:catechol 2,3-dioxygenase
MPGSTRRLGALGIHSLDHFCVSVPDLGVAKAFYERFGLDVHEAPDGIELYTYGNDHCWARIVPGPRKAIQYICFGAFADDMDRFRELLRDERIPLVEGNEGARGETIRLHDPHGVLLEIKPAEKTSPSSKSLPTTPSGWSLRGAPMRGETPAIRPRRMSHALFFTPNINATVEFYCRTLGLRISDHPGPVAFLHGIHGSDHHLIAFAQSHAPGYHHSAWDVSSIEEVGLGAEQMAQAGHTRGWGLGRHVLGSNYFHYVRDPWGSYAEYSFDIDFIPADLDWKTEYPAPENSLYLWGPPPPEDFVENPEQPTQSAAATR